MPKIAVRGPAPELKHRNRLGYKGVKVINGASPNGQLPKVIGSGIFGYEGQSGGIFGGDTVPPGQHTGVFYNDDARFDYEVAQPDMQWNLLRRPGRPLYPGSDARGIVLVGPSMGGTTSSSNHGSISKVLVAAAIVAGGWWFLNRQKQKALEE